jgi:hypothetical protein
MLPVVLAQLGLVRLVRLPLGLDLLGRDLVVGRWRQLGQLVPNAPLGLGTPARRAEFFSFRIFSAVSAPYVRSRASNLSPGVVFWLM